VIASVLEDVGCDGVWVSSGTEALDLLVRNETISIWIIGTEAACAAEIASGLGRNEVRVIWFIL
jgi:hypothetical protein